MIATVSLAAACAPDRVTGPEGSRIPALLINDIYYTLGGELDIEIRPLGGAHGEVLRRVDCSAGVWLNGNTHVEDVCHLEEGDSDFLPAGTVLYRIQDVEPDEALAVYRVYDVSPPIAPEWRELLALRSTADPKCVPGTGNLCTPNGGSQ